MSIIRCSRLGFSSARRADRAARRRRGTTLLEIIVVLAATGLAATVALPAAFAWSRGLRMHLASAEVVGAMQSARLYAIRHQANVALKFRTDPKGGVTFTLYRDGDGDGVRNADIDTGRDPQIGQARNLGHFGRLVRMGFPPGFVPRDPGSGRPMTRLHDPIRFNNSDLASWSPLGTSTPGSIYLTDGDAALWAVRVNQHAGRMRIIVYDAVAGIWHRH